MTTALDLLPIIQGIEAVRDSKLTAAEKDVIISEMRAAVPGTVYCSRCQGTREIIIKLLEPSNGRPKSATKKITAKSKDPSWSSADGEKQLLRNSNADGRRKTPPTRVVKKT